MQAFESAGARAESYASPCNDMYRTYIGTGHNTESEHPCYIRAAILGSENLSIHRAPDMRGMLLKSIKGREIVFLHYPALLG